uniref:Serine protease n=1 Tax=Astyanax mexicanus TaxID=7994 RepID=A0A3B1JN32_ASTMX
MAHSHSFKFCKKDNSDPHQINCTSSGTVLQALQTSDHFTTLVNNQTFIIERKKKNPLMGELLHIHTFTEEKDQKDKSTKVKDEGAQDAEDAQKTKPASGELITFTVESKGGKNTKSKQIVRNKILKDFKTLSVYAYSEDTIEEALKRDGRFADTVFHDRCKLHDLNDKTKLEEESTMTKSEKTENQEKKTHKKSSNMPAFLNSCVKEISGTLPSQFPELVKCMAEITPSECCKEYLQLIREAFIERTRAFSTMCQVEKLVNLGTSVCTVNTATSHGTGFLLFDNFILTNAHVIEKSYDIQSKTLKSAATVNFNMGSGTSLEFPLSPDVFAVLYGRDEAGRYVDFALLKLQDCEYIMKNEDISKLPRLLKEYTSNPHAGGICIIGHPRSGVKRIDVSCIEPQTETILRSASGDFIQLSFSFLPDHMQSGCKIDGCNVNTYRTYFLYGSSGSPVFDEKCKLFAMHTGVYFTDEIREYAIGCSIPLHSIIQNIIKQLASRESLDVMFKFIETAAQNPCLEEYLKECEKYLKELAEALMRNQSERNAEMLARIYFEINRNGMWNLSQKIHQVLYINKKEQYFQLILRKIDVSRLSDFLASKYD